MKWVLHFDGACEPNPGMGSWGYVISDSLGAVVCSRGGFLGDGVTNNVAEYAALGNGLKAVAGLVNPGDVVDVRGDSQLVINQLKFIWRCNQPRLQKCMGRACELLNELTGQGIEYVLGWVPREQNEAADEQSRKAWEAATGRTFPGRRV